MDQPSLSEENASSASMTAVGLPDCGPHCWLKLLCQSSTNEQHCRLNECSPPSSGEEASNRQRHLYTPLLPWQTRILCIHPAALSDSLYCDLYVADLVCFPGLGLSSAREIVQFEALSYTWGSSALDTVIYCNEVPFPVTRNL